MFYVGSESGYGGWISSYVLRRGVVDDKTQAAFVASVYWGGLTAGRLLAIPIAITLTTSTHLQVQLAQAVVGVVLCLTILDNSYLTACVASGVYSFALSSIFPLALTVVQDYGFETDASATASFICVVFGRRLHASGGGPTHGGHLAPGPALDHGLLHRHAHSNIHRHRCQEQIHSRQVAPFCIDCRDALNTCHTLFIAYKSITQPVSGSGEVGPLGSYLYPFVVVQLKLATRGTASLPHLFVCTNQARTCLSSSTKCGGSQCGRAAPLPQKVLVG